MIVNYFFALDMTESKPKFQEEPEAWQTLTSPVIETADVEESDSCATAKFSQRAEYIAAQTALIWPLTLLQRRSACNQQSAFNMQHTVKLVKIFVWLQILLK